MKGSVESTEVRNEDQNGWMLEVKFRRAVQGHGSVHVNQVTSQEV